MIAKSGTSDLFHHLEKHPYIRAGVEKEHNFWGRQRFGKRVSRCHIWTPATIQQYSEVFDVAAQNAKAQTVIYDNGTGPYVYHPLRIGEASVSTLHDNHEWRCLEENVCSDEPRATTPSYIMHIQSSARFIAILRDPVTRLYSDCFWYKITTRLSQSCY